MASTRKIGTVRWVPPAPGVPGHWKARVRLSNKQRPWIHFFDMQDPLDEDGARAKAQRAEKTAQRAGWKPSRAAKRVPSTETVSDWFERYHDLKEARGQSTVDDKRGRFRNYVERAIGHLVMADVSADDLEGIVREIDAAIHSGAIRWKTGDNIWGDVTAAFNEACRSKEPSLRVRSDNPTLTMAGPDRGDEAAKTILYPSEFVALVSCEKVPLVRRRLYAVAVYLAARANEIVALVAEDFDLAHRKVTISKQRDRKTDGNKKTKTKRVRVVDVEPELVPLVRSLMKERPEGRLFADAPPDEQRAVLLRADLKSAGVTRAALHGDGDPAHLPIWFHHLRDTGLTWMAVRGDDPLRIQWRGGHTDFKTTQGYIAQGKNLAGGFGVPFPALPIALLGDAADSDHGWTTDGSESDSERENEGVPNGIRSRAVASTSGEQAETSGNSADEPPRNSPEVSGSRRRSDQTGPKVDDPISASITRGATRDLTLAATLREGVEGALAGDEKRTLAALERAAADLTTRGAS